MRALALALAILPLSASADPMALVVALVDDPELPPLDDDLVGRAMVSAAETFASQFGVEAPRFQITARFSLDAFMRRYAKASSPECAPLFAARYKGGGKPELLGKKDAAIKFFQRWPLAELKTFFPEADRAGIADYAALHAAYMDRWLATVAGLEALSTPKGTPLVKGAPIDGRSHAAWTCALAAQDQFDVIVTNTFIMADILTEPHPHAVFGKGKVGGIAAPSPGRRALGGQALVASTFSIDTPLATLSELDGKPATVEERASILGAFLLAHEIGHAIYGIPDVFDHPAGCLMTTRPGESYREALGVLLEHPGPCPRCRPYVEARATFDQGRAKLALGDASGAVASLTSALKQLPQHFHGKKRRVAAIVTLAAQGYEELGDAAKAKRYAQLALDSDPASVDAKALLARAGKVRPKSPAPLPVSAARELPPARTSTAG